MANKGTGKGKSRGIKKMNLTIKNLSYCLVGKRKEVYMEFSNGELVAIPYKSREVGDYIHNVFSRIFEDQKKLGGKR